MVCHGCSPVLLIHVTEAAQAAGNVGIKANWPMNKARTKRRRGRGDITMGFRRSGEDDFFRFDPDYGKRSVVFGGPSGSMENAKV